MFRAYADVHVKWSFVQALRVRGMDVARAQDRGHDEADDRLLLAHALTEERAMLTNDKGFLVLAAKLQSSQEVFAPIFFWPQQRRSVGDVVRSILTIATRVSYEQACSQVYYV